MHRRKFFRFCGGLVFAFGIYGVGHYYFLTPHEEENEKAQRKNTEKVDDKIDKIEIPKRKLGRTGYEVSIFSLGGEAALLTPGKEEEAQNIIKEAIEEGVNYIDTAPIYGDGLSESNIGKALNETGYRGDIVLATKTHDRSYDGTMRLFEESIERLQTDYLDIYQLHNITGMDELNMALASDGAIKAVEELKASGDIKYIGITSHNAPDVLMEGFGEFDFDTALVALNAADDHKSPFQAEFLDMAIERDVGVIAMKVVGKGNMLREGGVSKMVDALGYTLTFPVSNAIVGISNVDQLRENIEIAKYFEPLPEEELERIESLTATYYDEVNYR